MNRAQDYLMRSELFGFIIGNYTRSLIKFFKKILIPGYVTGKEKI